LRCSGLALKIPLCFFKVAVWKGEVSLTNVELKTDVFDALGLPLRVQRGAVSKVVLQVPWSKLSSEPVKLYLSDINLLLERAADEQIVTAWDRAIKKQRLAAFDASHMQTSEGDAEGGDASMTQKLMWMIVNNLQVLYCTVLLP